MGNALLKGVQNHYKTCIYFNDASLWGSNKVITSSLRQHENGCNTFFSDSRPSIMIRPAPCVGQAAPSHREVRVIAMYQKANAINSVVSGWEALVECCFLTNSMKPGFCKCVNLFLEVRLKLPWVVSEQNRRRGIDANKGR